MEVVLMEAFILFVMMDFLASTPIEKALHKLDDGLFGLHSH
ncbi:hypothetical protein ACFVAD_13995 [Sutcliffiella sp. NPDC057660]